MKRLDRWLQDWRIDRAKPYIRPGTRVLDIGSADGALFTRLRARISEGVGIDPALEHPVQGPGYQLLPGKFPDGLEEVPPFDAITMLAVLEHIPLDELASVSRSCARLLKPGGQLIITVPSPRVDRILHWLMRLRLIDGMAAHEHHGFDVRMTPSLFLREGLRLVAARRFQLGLNHLFVFEKPSDVPALAEVPSLTPQVLLRPVPCEAWPGLHPGHRSAMSRGAAKQNRKPRACPVAFIFSRGSAPGACPWELAARVPKDSVPEMPLRDISRGAGGSTLP